MPIPYVPGVPQGKRFGKKRVPGCRCEPRFTCGPCLNASIQEGLPQGYHCKTDEMNADEVARGLIPRKP